VTPDRLRRWNKLKGNDLRHGRILTIYKPLAPGEGDPAPLRKSKKGAKGGTQAKSPKAAAPVAKKL